MTSNHHNNFTLLRLIAALLVVVSHSYYLTGNEVKEPLYIISKHKLLLSDIGLNIFFFTSGYLVTKSLFNTTNYLQFLYKRVLRIYPALLLAILITVFIIGLTVTTLSFTDYFNSKTTWLYLLTITGIKIQFLLPGVFNGSQFLSNAVNGSLWTIALEIKLYLLVMFISIFSYKKNRMMFSLISTLLLLICVGGIAYHISITTPFIDDKILKLITCFLIGSIV
ncbi:MAG: acyltransferase, partial [Deinococcales bacterium]|nr:acyltransferase [Chitinophagaceae bacterium]